MRHITIIISIMLSSCSLLVHVSSGSGIVIDTETNETISNAVIKMRCTRITGYHSTEEVRTVLKKSDENGIYSFTSKDVRDCDTAYVHVLKEGYISSSGLHVGYSIRQSPKYDGIPEKMFLTKNEDANIVRIRSRCSTNIRSYPISSINKPRTEEMRVYHSEYYSQYQDFIKSIEHAITEREIKYFKECHCDSLIYRFSKITPDGFNYLSKYNINKNTHRNIVNYCSNKNVSHKPANK